MPGGGACGCCVVCLLRYRSRGTKTRRARAAASALALCREADDARASQAAPSSSGKRTTAMEVTGKRKAREPTLRELAGADDTIRPDGSRRKEPKPVREGWEPESSAEKYVAPRPPQRLLGEVIEYNTARGFGFIKPDDLTANVFMHYSAACSDKSEVRVGDRVEFERIEAAPGEKADRAENVRRMAAPRRPSTDSAKRMATLVPRSVAKKPAAKASSSKRPPSQPSEAGVCGYPYG